MQWRTLLRGRLDKPPLVLHSRSVMGEAGMLTPSPTVSTLQAAGVGKTACSIPVSIVVLSACTLTTSSEIFSVQPWRVVHVKNARGTLFATEGVRCRILLKWTYYHAVRTVDPGRRGECPKMSSVDSARVSVPQFPCRGGSSSLATSLNRLRRWRTVALVASTHTYMMAVWKKSASSWATSNTPPG